jgi:hypothetical protein
MKYRSQRIVGGLGAAPAPFVDGRICYEMQSIPRSDRPSFLWAIFAQGPPAATDLTVGLELDDLSRIKHTQSTRIVVERYRKVVLLEREGNCKSVR